jgi:hypothetical protein
MCLCVRACVVHGAPQVRDYLLALEAHLSEAHRQAARLSCKEAEVGEAVLEFGQVSSPQGVTACGVRQVCAQPVLARRVGAWRGRCRAATVLIAAAAHGTAHRTLRWRLAQALERLGRLEEGNVSEAFSLFSSRCGTAGRGDMGGRAGRLPAARCVRPPAAAWASVSGVRGGV